MLLDTSGLEKVPPPRWVQVRIWCRIQDLSRHFNIDIINLGLGGLFVVLYSFSGIIISELGNLCG